MPKKIFSKKLLPLYAILLAGSFFLALPFFLSPCTQEEPADTHTPFSELCGQILQNELSGNTLNLHYTLAYPENYGIAHTAPSLPCYAGEDAGSAGQAIDTYLNALSFFADEDGTAADGISSDRLSDAERLTHTLLVRYLTQTKEGLAFPYYGEPLSPVSGMQSELPILLAEYAFRSRTDVEDYLGLLDMTDEYFASLLLYEQEKKAAGLLQSDAALAQVCEQCLTILTGEELACGTHFLQTTFAEKIFSLTEKGLITQEEADAYLACNDRLLAEVMQPAYEALADGLKLLAGDGSREGKGLCSTAYANAVENVSGDAGSPGKEYYAWLIRRNTGSSRSVPEIKKLLYPRFESVYTNLHNSLQESSSLEAWMEVSTQKRFYLDSPQEMLEDLGQRMAADFPALPAAAAESGSPSVRIKSVSESLEAYSAPAFYLTPPIDDIDNNVIYINQSSSPQGLELYTTLAHEGYPGHLYQAVYFGSSHSGSEYPVRQILWYGGYQEGWALYVELQSFAYAADLARENGDEEAATAYLIEQQNRDLQLCLYALLDISIHYDGADRQQVVETLKLFGIEDAEAADRIYDYIVNAPANYLKYYLGYLEILALKERAQSLWGEEYTDLRFHTFLLDCGPCDFDTLGEELEKTAASADISAEGGMHRVTH